jgi:hypothetical protein
MIVNNNVSLTNKNDGVEAGKQSWVGDGKVNLSFCSDFRVWEMPKCRRQRSASSPQTNAFTPET